jgi:prepilin-type N-terminal cleavage/methylation domain-containing protein/prepilin-type processing-associated H-X9-DG protein
MRKSRAFTLVELLVVIGIIALLISILMPTLASARRAGNTVKCLSNLRQVGTALQMYTGDFKGAIPWCRDDTNGLSYWSDFLAPYVSRLQGATANNTQQQDEIRQSVIWGCTEWIARMDLTTSQRFYPGYAWTLHPYLTPEDTKVTNAKANANWPGVYPPSGKGITYKIGSIRHSADRVLAADSLLWLLDARHNTPGGGVASLPGQPVDQLTGYAGMTGQKGQMDYDLYRHAKRPSSSDGTYLDKSSKIACNLVYFDGHAATITGFEEAYTAIFIKAP